jgi:hypothetical protein
MRKVCFVGRIFTTEKYRSPGTEDADEESVFCWKNFLPRRNKGVQARGRRRGKCVLLEEFLPRRNTGVQAPRTQTRKACFVGRIFTTEKYRRPGTEDTDEESVFCWKNFYHGEIQESRRGGRRRGKCVLLEEFSTTKKYRSLGTEGADEESVFCCEEFFTTEKYRSLGTEDADEESVFCCKNFYQREVQESRHRGRR